jgi:predicted DNA-binding transcriptional regulator YafY
MDTATRLLRLLSLLQAKRDWTGPELAQRLGVTVRTVRRDVERLRELDYPVHATVGVAGGYRLAAGAAMPPLTLDDDEAVAVAVGLRTAVGGTIAGIEETSVRALAKLEQVLPARLRRRVNALQSMVVPMVGGGPIVDPENLSIIAAACRDHQSLRIEYRSGADDTTRGRVVEPHRLACTGRRWYLLAWDPERDGWRTFRVDRIASRPSPRARFTPREPPEGGDLAAYISRSIASAPYPYQARVTLHASAEQVSEQVTPASGLVEAVDEHSCVLHAGGSDLGEIPIYLARIGFDFTVHEPPELVEQVRTLAGQFSRSAARAGNARPGHPRSRP